MSFLGRMIKIIIAVAYIVVFALIIAAIKDLGGCEKTLEEPQETVCLEAKEPEISYPVVVSCTNEPELVIKAKETAEKSETVIIITQNYEVIEEPKVKVPTIDCPLDYETQEQIFNLCEEYEVDYALVLALIYSESRFDPDVISTTNDYGLMQINSCNHYWLQNELGITDFLDPVQNATCGIYMLHNLFEKYTYPSVVLMAYNMGEGNAKKLWENGIYTTDYAEEILRLSDIYKGEINERMGF